MTGTEHQTASASAGGKTPPPTRTTDAISLGIAAAAIILFVGTGGATALKFVASFQGSTIPPDNMLTSALLLNVALILFGWRRYRQLAGEVTLHRMAEEMALKLAERDPLTGFLNRRSLVDAAESLIASARERGEAIAVLMADLDRFKQINDMHGHVIGDEVLQRSAARIAALLPPRALTARIGGDEFACLVPFDPRHPERIDALAAALIDAVATPAKDEAPDVEITVSVGIARSDRKRRDDPVEDEIGAWLHAADMAMYHAKREGRNRYYWFDPAMENALRVRRELESGVRNGIANGEFVPYYEQQIDLATGRLTGFEMLARWNSPAFGMVGPQVFIPLAEEMGVIDKLSESLIAQALVDARAWDSGLSLSVNISPIQLRDPWFAQKLLRLLVEANFPPQRLEIEITESCVLENVAAVRSLLASLKNQGIRISLDDFGTGYSSLGHINDLPIDAIKLDRSFVMMLAQGRDSASIVRTITALGQQLGLPITAEGIENEQVLKELRLFGDFRGQGYLYGQPENSAQTRQRLADLNLLASPDVTAPQDSRKTASG